jgi:hypothetical protein
VDCGRIHEYLIIKSFDLQNLIDNSNQSSIIAGLIFPLATIANQKIVKNPRKLFGADVYSIAYRYEYNITFSDKSRNGVASHGPK